MRRFISRFSSRKSFSGATRVEFLDVITAIVVLAVLVYAATRQFPGYTSAPAPSTTQSQAH